MNTPQKTATITFTAEEARVTLQLFDAAVKALGLNAAEAASVLAKKINSAFEEPKQEALQQLPPATAVVAKKSKSRTEEPKLDVLQQLPPNGN